MDDVVKRQMYNEQARRLDKPLRPVNSDLTLAVKKAYRRKIPVEYTKRKDKELHMRQDDGKGSVVMDRADD